MCGFTCGGTSRTFDSCGQCGMLAGMQIVPVACLQDNYAYLVVDEGRGVAAVVDPSETDPVRRALDERGLKLEALWLTHHHWDHVGGVEGLVDAYGDVEVLGSSYDSERGRIPCQTRTLGEGDTFSFGGHEVRVIENPGHTLGAITFVVDGHAFTGDTLFLGGCGRVFEGDMKMMAESMRKLRQLPGETRIWCGHEYTTKNLEFAKSVEPGSEAIADRLAEAKGKRERGEPTVPGTMRDELETNPFLRFDRPELMKDKDPAESFGAIRKAKDRF